jgi:hypothetical protein
LRSDSKLETLKPYSEMLPAGSMREKRRQAIQAELDAGRSLAAVHAEHREALGIGYVQFTRYVRHYLRQASDAGRSLRQCGRHRLVRQRPDKASS